MAANSTSTYIARDLLEDILLKLPLKYIIRFKSVSKQWKSLMESQSFVERHLKNSRRRRKILLALNNDEENQEEEEEEGFCYIRDCDGSKISLTCDGLICVPRTDFIEVCNPATRESRRFPPGEPLVSKKRPTVNRIPVRSIWHKQKLEGLVAKFPTARSSFGFGRDEVTGGYKFVQLRGKVVSFLVEDCNVLDLETRQWRRVGFVPYRVFATERSVCLNGSVHWFTIDIWEPDAVRIVAFDLHTEEFRAVSYPNFYVLHENPYSSELLSLGNRLSVSEMWTVPDVRLDIWSMVDVEEERWAKMHSILVCHVFRGRSQLFTPVAIAEEGDGDVVIVWDYQETLFKACSYKFCKFPLHVVSTEARVVSSSYIQTLVRVP